MFCDICSSLFEALYLKLTLICDKSIFLANTSLGEESLPRHNR